MWNLGNEPDLFAYPRDALTGRSWVEEMTQLVKGIDSDHPVTTGLHTDSLFADNGPGRHVFDESDVAAAHGYPMYVDWARDPLDPDFVPYLPCALVTALWQTLSGRGVGRLYVARHLRLHDLGVDRLRSAQDPVHGGGGGVLEIRGRGAASFGRCRGNRGLHVVFRRLSP